MALLVSNTLTRKKEELVPRDPGRIGMYVCGPTVYNHIHLGNARAAIVFDVIRRYLVWRGFEVTFVQNYTDVDDKIIAKAAQEGRSADEVASEYAAAFEKAMEQVGVKPPDLLVKATDHICDMVDMITKLIDNGFAYESMGNVWFAVEKFADYGKLSGRSLDDVRAGERVEPDPSKHSPLDFAVWKAAKPGEPAWDSPWGPGRPGWHIECSAMSAKYLGMGFDIHGGGSDLVFPHHENEIAQSEAASGEKPFVRNWIHNGMVNFDAEKMSKSLGNVVLVKDFLTQIPGSVLRLMAIAGHYRSDVDFGEHSLAQAKRLMDRINHFASTAGPPGSSISTQGQEFVDKFTAAMDDDFNTPVALSVIYDLLKVANKQLQLSPNDNPGDGLMGLVAAFNEMAGVLGLLPAGLDGPTAADPSRSDGLVELAIELRNRARAERRFEEADWIRSTLEGLGIALEDGPQGTRWVART